MMPMGKDELHTSLVPQSNQSHSNEILNRASFEFGTEKPKTLNINYWK
jgi:hypothetical protein